MLALQTSRKKLMATLFLVFWGWLALVGQSQAADGKALQVYPVAGGDTLWLLSQRYEGNLAELKATNQLTTDTLLLGQTLYLPVVLKGQGIVYRVQAGDTFYLISRRTGRTIDAIKNLSNLSSDLITSGQAILIPAARSGANLYQVVSGDSLYKIGQRFQVSVQDIMTFNRLTTQNILIGELLEIPATRPQPDPIPQPQPQPAPQPQPQPKPEPQPQPQPQPPPASQADQYERQVLELVNAQRSAAGLDPLTWDSSLAGLARTKSEDMRDNHYFAHQSPTLGSAFEMIRRAGISYRYAGENIAAGQKTPAAVVDAWMNSPGHRANILNARYTSLGVGFASGGNYGAYWTQMFIGN